MIDKIALAIKTYTFLDHETLIFAGVIVQVICLFFKVNLLNWKDDLIHVITFCAFHCFISCCLFILIPWLANNDLFQTKHQIILVALFTTLAFFKALHTIPLEFTIFRMKEQSLAPLIDFDEHYTGLRENTISQLQANSAYDELRIKWIKEKLPRQAKKKSTQISGFS